MGADEQNFQGAAGKEVSQGDTVLSELCWEPVKRVWGWGVQKVDL